MPYANLGELFGGKSGGTTHALYTGDYTKEEDKLAEEGVTEKLAEAVSTRYNYYTVIVCAQAIQDVGLVGAEIDIDGTLCQLDRYDSGGDQIIAEHKLLAILRRDSRTNEVSVIHTETLME
jgi:hypothetical protein